MPRNIEIKARIRDYEATLTHIKAISDSKPELLVQEDTFFHSTKGRLKLRVFADLSCELIYYKRSNKPGPKQSQYQLFRLADPIEIKRWFSEMFGVKGIVRKQRILYKVGNTRIHLDRVDSLGDFIELEVVLDIDQSQKYGEGIARVLMNKLGIHSDDLISCAYLDLLTEPNQSIATETSILNRKTKKLTIKTNGNLDLLKMPVPIQKRLF